VGSSITERTGRLIFVRGRCTPTIQFSCAPCHKNLNVHRGMVRVPTNQMRAYSANYARVTRGKVSAPFRDVRPESYTTDVSLITIAHLACHSATRCQANGVWRLH